MALCLASPIKAWGGLFNRFNPSLMSDVYGAGSYGKQLYSAADGGKVNQVCFSFLYTKIQENPEKSREILENLGISRETRENQGNSGKFREIQGNSGKFRKN